MANGKVSEQTIYQDEAKALFTYFKQASDRILSQEKESKEKQSRFTRQIAETTRKRKQTTLVLTIFLVLGAALAIYTMLWPLAAIPVLFLLLLVGKKAGTNKKINSIKKKLDAEEQAFKDIRRDYPVKRMGVVYIPIAEQVPFNDKSMTVDLSGNVPETSFTFTTLAHPEKANQLIASIKDKFQHVPTVESSTHPNVVDTADYSVSMQNIPLHDYMGELENSIEELADTFQNEKKTSAQLPVIRKDSPMLEFLQNCCTTDVGDNPILPYHDLENLQEQLDNLDALMNQQKLTAISNSDAGIEDFALQFGGNTQSITTAKIRCCNSILAYNNNIFANVLKASTLNYSLKMEAEEISRVSEESFDFNDIAQNYQPFSLKFSSQVRYDLDSKNWVDEEGNHMSVPFSISQIQQEILMPIVTNLMRENRLEREKLYQKFESEKRDYLNQWNKETTDFFGRNRTSADDLKSHIVETQAKFNEAYASWNSIKKTMDAMEAELDLEKGKVEALGGETKSSIVAAAGITTTNFQKQCDDFDAFMNRIQDDITEKASRFGKVLYYEAALRDLEAQKVAQATINPPSGDERRKQLLKVSPYFAAYAELPPQPDMVQEVYDNLQVDLQERKRPGRCFSRPKHMMTLRKMTLRKMILLKMILLKMILLKMILLKMILLKMKSREKKEKKMMMMMMMMMIRKSIAKGG
jgi:hypothetical protein